FQHSGASGANTRGTPASVRGTNGAHPNSSWGIDDRFRCADGHSRGYHTALDPEGARSPPISDSARERRRASSRVAAGDLGTRLRGRDELFAGIHQDPTEED